ncbi:mechanosensitive ion channel protein [Streptomyces sp. NRRL F-6602]|nr:mechanosensitive ion channel protein [Streptomyces sp. NRRL F-6602]
MSNTPVPAKSGVFTGFKAFLMRGNVVELAVAVVVGAAFGKIVDAVVKGFINPLVGAIGTQDLDKYRSCLKGPCVIDADGTVTKGVALNWGPVLSATLTFLITAAVVYFLMILPMNKYKERQQAKAGPVEVPKTEIELLTEIRDVLLAQQAEGNRSDGSVPGAGAGLAKQRESGVDIGK